MNNDLEHFSEERLKEIADFAMAGAIEVVELARIALAAKQEIKVNATLRNINLNLSREAYSASVELNDFLKDNQHVYQIMNSVGESQLWLDCSEDAYKCEIDEGGDGRILFTTPPANSPAIPDGWKLVPAEPTQEMVDACFEATSAGGIQKGYRAMLAAAPKPESE